MDDLEQVKTAALPAVTWSDVKTAAEAARALLLSFEALGLVGNLIAYATVEATQFQAYDFPLVEYAALVAWHELADLADAAPIDGASTENVVKTLRHLFFTVARYYASEEKRASDMQDRAELAHRLRSAGLAIRVPAYEVHQKRVLRGIFGPFAENLQHALGFTVEDAIKCIDAIYAFVEAAIPRFQTDGKLISSQGEMDAHLAKLGEYLCFDVAEIAALSGVDVARIQAVLETFALERGIPDEHALIPSPFSILRALPLLQTTDNRFIVPSHALLFPSIQPRIEDLINPSVNQSASAGLWTRYQEHRGSWVEEEAERLVRSMLPGGTGFVGGYYHIDAGDGLGRSARRQVESDVTYKIDDVLILIEGKSGTFTPATFRGGAGSVASDVKEIITKGHEQSMRTQAWVLAGNRTLENSDGTVAYTIPEPIREIIRMVVTLDSASVLATASAQMQRAGFMAGEPTWVLSLADLMILSEALSRPGELRHYGRRRYESILHEHVLVHDETDYLGMYLRHNDTTIMYGEADTVMLSGYIDELDAYYVGQSVAKPPALAIPAEIVTLIEALARTGAEGWTQAVCDLFAMGGTLETISNEIRERISTARPRDFSLRLTEGGVLTVLIMPNADPLSLVQIFVSGLAFSPNKVNGKRLFIAYDPAGKSAVAQYRQRVGEKHFFVPPALTWGSSITRK